MAKIKAIFSILFRIIVGIVFIYGLAVGVGATVGYFIGKEQKQASILTSITKPLPGMEGLGIEP